MTLSYFGHPLNHVEKRQIKSISVKYWFCSERLINWFLSSSSTGFLFLVCWSKSECKFPPLPLRCSFLFIFVLALITSRSKLINDVIVNDCELRECKTCQNESHTNNIAYYLLRQECWMIDFSLLKSFEPPAEKQIFFTANFTAKFTNALRSFSFTFSIKTLSKTHKRKKYKVTPKSFVYHKNFQPHHDFEAFLCVYP